ncbi:hypothetical protein pdam_00023269 [Pocillopora damicornis]|uniref:Uncharacterized protein n=1 Tax=Pocillopora damicornis TaxID=46731 RepID=A0A3M6TYM4_POCDA|nr:hypothetical protein pdam_00023269 [Pocillopora damicornis]
MYFRQLPSVDLGGGTPDHLPWVAPSPRPSCTATGMERNPIGDKKRPISPLAIIAVKRFSFEGIDKRQDFCASKNPRAGTTPAEAEAEADKSLTIVSESLQVVISETRSTGKNSVYYLER